MSAASVAPPFVENALICAEIIRQPDGTLNITGVRNQFQFDSFPATAHYVNLFIHAYRFADMDNPYIVRLHSPSGNVRELGRFTPPVSLSPEDVFLEVGEIEFEKPGDYELVITVEDEIAKLEDEHGKMGDGEVFLFSRRIPVKLNPSLAT